MVKYITLRPKFLRTVLVIEIYKQKEVSEFKPKKYCIKNSPILSFTFL